MPTASAASPDGDRSSRAAPLARAQRAEHRLDRDAERAAAAAPASAACCAARISVGAISADCTPLRCASTIAAAATSVLPLPTSPCSSRFIGAVRAMSAQIRSITRRCAPVGANGSCAANASQKPPGTVSARAPPSASRRARLTAAASAIAKNSSNTIRSRARPRRLEIARRVHLAPGRGQRREAEARARARAAARRRARRSGGRGSWRSRCGSRASAALCSPRRPARSRLRTRSSSRKTLVAGHVDLGQQARRA